jgi:predicted nucleic acid-binding protein
MIDVLIGHIALELEVPLYTFNQKHYRVISRLTVIQPYTR